MEFSRPEYWSVSPFPSPGDLPDPGIEPRSPTLQADFYQLILDEEFKITRILLSNNNIAIVLFFWLWYYVMSQASKSPHQANVVTAVTENLGNFPG